MGKDPMNLEVMVSQMLYEAGVSLQDPNFRKTPQRFSKVLQEFLQPAEHIDKLIEEYALAVFPSVQDEMVVFGNVRVYSLCNHHLLPVFYRVALGYVPEGSVIGLSKLPRLAKELAKVPLLQEDYTVRLQEALSKLLQTQNVGVIVEGRHLCMEMRGVEQDQVNVVTSKLSGIFLEGGVKREFMQLGKVSQGGW